jgi:hypothetical protein
LVPTDPYPASIRVRVSQAHDVIRQSATQ